MAEDGKIMLDVPKIGQANSRCCWLACYKMLYRYKGRSSSEVDEKIASAGLSSTDALYDDQWPAAAKALGLSGMRVAHLKGLDGMLWCLGSCGPIWCAGNFLEDGSPHAVVISGYDPNGNKLRINDPYEIYKYDAYRWFTHDGWCKMVRVAPFACQLWW